MDPTYKGLPTPLPTVQGSRKPNFRRILMIAGGFLLLIIVLGLLFGRGSGNGNDTQRLLYRLDALITLTQGAKNSLSDDSLEKINAELSLMLVGNQTALTNVISTSKITKELKAIKLEEADADTTETLKTALANGMYNATYKQVLKEKIDALFTLASTVSQTAGPKTKTAIATLNQHLSIYSNQLTETN